MKVFYLMLFFIVVITSCQKNNNNVGTSSTSGKSHYSGQNCMKCHNGTNGMTIAGTVYDSVTKATLSGVTIKIYTKNTLTGSPICTLQSDASGNFYMSSNLDFSTGVYPATQGKTKTYQHVSVVKSGQCNSCHGVTTSKIWAR